MDEHTRDPTVPPPRRGDPTGWDAERGLWEHATLRRAVLEGAWEYRAGDYHAAHDCFEEEWYNYGSGSTESAFCHGMVQVAAGAYKHYDFEDDAGMRSLFATALDYLADVPDDFYGVDVVAVRRRIDRARVSPTVLDGWELPVDVAEGDASLPELPQGDDPGELGRDREQRRADGDRPGADGPDRSDDDGSNPESP